MPVCRNELALSRKVAILAELLRRVDLSEIPIAVGLLSGVPQQGRVGVGYSTVSSIEREPAREASLTVDELDRAIVEDPGGDRKRIGGQAQADPW